MSKLVERLKQLSRAATPSIGFKPASATPQRVSMVFIVYFPQIELKQVKMVADIGVDGVLMPKEFLGSKEEKQIFLALKDIPLGVVLGEVNLEDIAQVTQSGSDFIVFSPKTPVEILEIKEVGKILEIKPSFDPGLVRGINSLPLPVDGVVISGDESFLTVENFLVYQRLIELLDKPILARVPSSISANQLNSLWGTGIDGVVISGDQSKERLLELKKAISALSPRRRKEGKVTAILPVLPQETGVEVEEEEEEEI